MAAISQEQWDHIVATMQGTQQVLEQQRAYMEGLEQRVAEAQYVANQANARAPEPPQKGRTRRFLDGKGTEDNAQQQVHRRKNTIQ